MKKLSILSFLICLAVFALFAVACPNQAKQSDPPPKKDKPEPEPDIPSEENKNIPYDVMAKSVHVALVDKDNKRKEYLPVKDFNETVSGPYAAAQDAETAYVYLKIEMEEQPAQGKDFSIYLQNTSAWIPYIYEGSKDEKVKNEKQIFTLRRGRNTNSKFFLSRSPIPLSIGKNILAVTIIPPDGNEKNKGTYLITVNYDGGPGVEFVKKNKAPIPGIYCAAQRKTYKDEKEEFLWMIVVQGFCGYCPVPLEAAGYKGKIAEKYKNQGLRVVSISGDSYNDKRLIDKWMTAKADYPLYTKDKNIFYEFYPGGGVPYDACIKQGERVDENKGALRGAAAYDKYIKKTFKFK